MTPVIQPSSLGACIVSHLLGHFKFATVAQTRGDTGGSKRVAANVFGGCTDSNCPHGRACFTDREIENISHANPVLTAIGKNLNQIARNMNWAKLSGLPLLKNDILTFHGISELKSKILLNAFSADD